MTIIALTKKGIALTLVILIIATPLLAQEQGDSYFKGKVDGERAGEQAGAGILWYLVGCGGGPLWAYILEPDVPSAAELMGKSQEYIAGYNEGYKKAVRGERVKNAWYGCIIGNVVVWGCYLAILVPAMATSNQQTY